jgi:hypothetical protein
MKVVAEIPESITRIEDGFQESALVDRSWRRDHVAPMQHMVFLAPHHSASQVRQLRISLPLIECLVDGVRYFRPDDLPAPTGDELRPWLRPRITRGPSMRSMVRSALKNDLADETAKKWRRRFDRSLVGD